MTRRPGEAAPVEEVPDRRVMIFATRAEMTPADARASLVPDTIKICGTNRVDLNSCVAITWP